MRVEAVQDETHERLVQLQEVQHHFIVYILRFLLCGVALGISACVSAGEHGRKGKREIVRESERE